MDADLVKVLQVTSTPAGIGGVEQLLIDGAPLFERFGIAVEFVNLFAGRGDGRFAAALRDRGAAVAEFYGSGLLAVPAMVAALGFRLRRTRAAIVHTHMFHATVVGAVAGALARVKRRVVTRHFLAAGYAGRGPLSRRADAMALRTADHVIAVSSAVRDDVVTSFGVAPGRVSVIPNGIELRRFEAVAAPELRSSSGRPKRGITVGSVGSLLPWKGHAVLIRAAGLALREGVDVRVAIAGEGPERTSLQALVQEMGLGDRVQLVGFQPDIPAFLSTIDVYAHPALDEALGLAVLEAMAAGRPVIATRVGGIPDVIPDSHIGITVPPGDPRSLASAIQELSRNGARREMLATAARQRVGERFTVEATVERYAKLYRALATDAGAAAAPHSAVVA